jgi:hypothetical protein
MSTLRHCIELGEDFIVTVTGSEVTGGVQVPLMTTL